MVEPLRHQRRRRHPKRPLADTVARLDTTHVTTDLEIFVGNPARLGLGLDPVTRARIRWQPGLDLGAQRVQVEGLRSRLEYDQLQRVARDRPGLEPEDARVISA